MIDKLIVIYLSLITNEYLYKSNQNLVHYLSCQAVRCTAYRYLNFCSGLCLHVLVSKVQALALRVEALVLALRFWSGLHHCVKFYRNQRLWTKFHIL